MVGSAVLPSRISAHEAKSLHDVVLNDIVLGNPFSRMVTFPSSQFGKAY
jgi:hypothetical protein